MTVPAVRIGFLGAGKMATALARGWLHAGLVTPSNVAASDPSAEARAGFAKETGLEATSDNRAVVTQSDLLVLAVKPQSMPDLLQEISGAVTTRHLVVSIAAGVTLLMLVRGVVGLLTHRVAPAAAPPAPEGAPAPSSSSSSSAGSPRVDDRGILGKVNDATRR